MKRIIRTGVFESNSSSMHSLVILKEEATKKKDLLDGILLWKDGIWDIWDSNLEFGRSPFECLATFESKWRYCLAALCDHINDDVYKELERIAFKYIPGLTKIKLPTITDSDPIKGVSDSDYNKEYGKTEEEMVEFLKGLEKEYEIPEIDFWENGKGTDWVYEIPCVGYAEDYGMTKKFLEKNDISVEDFIVNPKYVVIVDGDEYCIFDQLKDSGIINKDAIEREFPGDDDWKEN